MLRIQRILFPTDFSSVAEEAFSHAAHLAARYGAQIHVFNVVTPSDEAEVNPMQYLPLQSAENGDNEYSMPVSKIDVETPAEESQTVDVVYSQIESVSPAEAIVRQAKDRSVDLIVMGTHGRQGLDRLLSGSVSEEVVRRAHCPVFTVLADGEEPTPGPYVGRILAAVDLSDQSERVVRHAAALASTYDAEVDLLHVVEEAAYPTIYGVDPMTPALPAIRERAEEELQSLAEMGRALGVTVNATATIGNAARTIVDAAEEAGVDLIVMATHGRTGLQRFLIGSVAEKVVRTAPCPVFAIKSFGPSLLADEAERGDTEEAGATKGEAEDTKRSVAEKTPDASP